MCTATVSCQVTMASTRVCEGLYDLKMADQGAAVQQLQQQQMMQRNMLMQQQQQNPQQQTNQQKLQQIQLLQ